MEVSESHMLIQSEVIMMTNTQLLGQVFNFEGTNYLVVAANDWSGETIQVRIVDNRKSLIEMPLETVLQHLGKPQN